MINNNIEFDQKKNVSFNAEFEFSFLEWAINKIVDNDYEFPYQEEFLCACRAVNDISKSNPDGAEKLHEKYLKTLEDYVSSEVLPHLKGKNGEILMKELVSQWNKYTPLKERLSGLFYSLDEYFIQPNQLPSLLKTSHSIFFNMIYTEFEDELRLVYKPKIQLEGNYTENIDEALMKTIEQIYEKSISIPGGFTMALRFLFAEH